jgi:hypothetical protein
MREVWAIDMRAPLKFVAAYGESGWCVNDEAARSLVDELEEVIMERVRDAVHNDRRTA